MKKSNFWKKVFFHVFFPRQKHLQCSTRTEEDIAPHLTRGDNRRELSEETIPANSQPISLFQIVPVPLRIRGCKFKKATEKGVDNAETKRRGHHCQYNNLLLENASIITFELPCGGTSEKLELTVRTDRAKKGWMNFIETAQTQGITGPAAFLPKKVAWEGPADKPSWDPSP